MVTIVDACTPDLIETARTLFQEYADSIGVDLCFQGFAEELKTLPGKYAPPSGGLFIALVDGEAAGCAALRPLEPPASAELKRLYVRRSCRGQGVGRLLTLKAIERAREAGYASVRLDTLASMKDAQRLYRAMGFREIPAYTFNPIPDAIYMELNLGGG